jgi:molybdate transport system regulatory protein
MKAALKIKIQFYLGEEIAFGPGKAELLEAIAREGSIAAAGRALGMSYRRAWLLVDTMNRCFAQPLVESVPGRARGGATRVTATGKRVLDAYRHIASAVESAAHDRSLRTIERLLRDAPRN